MKNLWKKVICVILAVGMLAQCPQQIYAEDAGNITMVEDSSDSVENGTNSDNAIQQPDNTQQPDGTQQPDNTQQPDGTQQPDDTQQPDGTQQPDDTQQSDDKQPEKLSKPTAVKNLHTTKQGKTKVCLEWEKSANATSYLIYRKTSGGAYRKLAESKKTAYTDKTLAAGKTYTYKIIAANSQKKSKAVTITFSNIKAVQIHAQKYTYAQMKKDIKELESMYSNYCEATVIGKSVQGRNIYDVAIGNPDADQSLLVVSTLHAREYICSAVMMKEIEYYLENYNGTIGNMTPANTLKNMQIHYIVMANPDGVTISQTKHATWKSNSRGVDLNRNFPTKKFVVGGKPGAQSYSGKKALSEPETYAVTKRTKELMRKQNLTGVVNYHAMGRIIFGDCSRKSIQKDTKTMYDIAKKETGYQKAYSSGGGRSWGGQYREYVMYMLNVPSITIEIGSSAAPCPLWQYETEFQKNKYVVLKIARAL